MQKSEMEITPLPVRRQITYEKGHAIDKLAHAIEYLEDMYIYGNGMRYENDGTFEAIEMLKAINRGIYLECPRCMSLFERIQGYIERHAFPGS